MDAVRRHCVRAVAAAALCFGAVMQWSYGRTDSEPAAVVVQTSPPDTDAPTASGRATAAPTKLVPASKCMFSDRSMTKLENAVAGVFRALLKHKNVTAWPAGGSLIHFVRHGRFSDYEEHDQEYDLDMAVASSGDDSSLRDPAMAQWIVDVLAAAGVVRKHKLTKKKSKAGTGTCRLRDKGHRIVCRHTAAPLDFDMFLGSKGGDRDTVHYAPLGVIPRAMLYPMRRCRAWADSIPCPADPVGVLKRWGVGTGYEPKEGCLLLPRHLQKFSSTGEPRNRRSEFEQYTRYLQQRSGELDQCGYASFSRHSKDAVCVEAVRGVLLGGGG
eukprot:TRINITY_DN11582_c0_g1_i1.p1 TRINITY_DN11582_c0_g1~~TRINITY_DN11582_c0_g1_i1.p1  ORF type:complete len:347 (+),score=38.06 TRINITY_DN11582_c0_g1_i1:63-1043(+)